MLGALQRSPASATRPEGMTAWQRRTLLTMLVGLGALVNVAFNQAGPALNLAVWGDSGYAMLGGLFAQSSLLAVWAGLGRRRLLTRVQFALGVSALLGLAVAWGEARQSLEGGVGLSFAVLMVFIATVQSVLLLLPMQWYWKWQVQTADDFTFPRRWQFNLRQLLLWTTAVAAILAAGRAIGFRDDASLDMVEMAMGVSIGMILVAVCLPFVIHSVSLILGDRKRSRAAAWLAGTAVATTLALFLTVFAFNLQFTVDAWPDAAWDAVSFSLPFQVGFIATLMLGLVVARLCGFRLSRGARDAAPSEQSPEVLAAPVPMAPASWRRSRFACVTLALGLVVGALAWPSWLIEQQRQERLRHHALWEEWLELSVDVRLQDDQVASARFEARELRFESQQLIESQRPVSELALDKLCNSPHSGVIQGLMFSGTSLTDDQMHHLAGLTNLEWLLLDGTHITDAGLVHLQGMSNLKHLALNGTRVGDEGLQALQGLSSLRKLDLDDTNVTDAGLVHLRSLPNLKGLGLARTRVTDKGLPEVQRLAKLQVLHLQGTPVTVAGLADLNGLPGLVLSGASSAIIDEIPPPED